MTARTIGLAGRDVVRRLGRRTRGVTVPEVEEELDVSRSAAYRFVQRMVALGVLERTNEHRRRTEVFERVHGRGGVVYRTVRRYHYRNQTRS